jgi:uncharacterized protein (DUF1778 family)
MALRVSPADKAVILRAAAIAQTDMTTFVVQAVLQQARAVIDQHERIKLSKRDTNLVMQLLENPPPPNAKLKKAARALQRRT